MRKQEKSIKLFATVQLTKHQNTPFENNQVKTQGIDRQTFISHNEISPELNR